MTSDEKSIKEAFAQLGIDTDEKRDRFKEMANIGVPKGKDKEYTFIRLGSESTYLTGGEDAELESDT